MPGRIERTAIVFFIFLALHRIQRDPPRRPYQTCLWIDNNGRLPVGRFLSINAVGLVIGPPSRRLAEPANSPTGRPTVKRGCRGNNVPLCSKASMKGWPHFLQTNIEKYGIKPSWYRRMG